MIKVLHYRASSGLYGADRWLLALFKNCKKTKQILCCTSDSNPDLINLAKKIGYTAKFIQVNSNYNIFEYIRKLSALLRIEDIDILHTHDYKSDIIGYYAAKKYNIPIITTLHGFSKEKDNKLRLLEIVQKKYLKKFDKVIAHSFSMKKEIPYSKNFAVIPNALDLAEINIKKRKNKLLTIGYIGQLIERKRIQDLIKAFSLLKHDSQLVIVGDGPLKKRLIKLSKNLGIRHKVIFTGFRTDRLNVLSTFDIYIQPSLLEGIPRSLLEAMAMEIPCIATNIPGNNILIKHEKTGLLVPVKSPKSIAQSIVYLIKNNKKALKLASNAKKLVNKEYSALLMAKRYEKLYNDING